MIIISCKDLGDFWLGQWLQSLFRIELLNFSMGFNIIAPYMEMLHINRSLHHCPENHGHALRGHYGVEPGLPLPEQAPECPWCPVQIPYGLWGTHQWVLTFKTLRECLKVWPCAHSWESRKILWILAFSQWKVPYILWFFILNTKKTDAYRSIHV